MRAHRRAPTWLKVIVVAAAVLFFPVTLGLIILAALIYAVVAVVQGRRTVGASASVAVWGVAVFFGLSSGNRTWLYSCAAAALSWSRWPRTPGRWPAGSCRAARSPGCWSGRCRSAVIALKASAAPAVHRHDRRVAAGRGRARLAGGQGHPGHPHVRRPGPMPRSPEGPTAGPAPRPRATRPAHGYPAAAPRAIREPASRGRPPGYGVPGPGRGAALRRPRRPRPPGRRAGPPGRGRRSRSRTPWPSSTR